MICSWCGSPQGVQLATTHAARPASVCGEPHPLDPRIRCGEERGHLSACKPATEDKPTPLCFRCFGAFRESGRRPPTARQVPLPGRLAVARTMPVHPAFRNQRR